MVAIYSVYNMVVAHLQNITVSFVSGMEALFGDMLAKKELKKLHDTFGYYETLLSYVTITLFSTAMVLIVPFVQVYTAGIEDAAYYQPSFAILLLLASVLYCLYLPYNSVVIAAGHFKQTKMAAYGEAIINIVMSIILVIHYGLIGVAIGTVAATAFRLVYYVIYLSHNIFNRKIGLFIKRIVVNTTCLVCIFLIGKLFLTNFTINNYRQWFIAGLAIGLIALTVTTLFTAAFYRSDLKPIFKKFIRR